MQSSLLFSLAQASRLALELGGDPEHVPRCGAVLSPGIEVFRRGVAQGFGPRQSVELAAVLSVALPGVVDSSFENVMETTFDSALRGANKVSARILVVPDVGGSASARLGEALGRALARSSGSVTKVVIVGSDAMYQSTRRGFASVLSGAPASQSPSQAIRRDAQLRSGRPEPAMRGDGPPPNGLGGSLGGDFRPRRPRGGGADVPAEPWKPGNRPLCGSTSNRSLLFGHS